MLSARWGRTSDMHRHGDAVGGRPSMPTAAPGISPHSASCSCDFSVCNAADLADFILRLPRAVLRRSSPIYSYLRNVYHAEVPLPFDVRRLEAFYPSLLPTAPCTVTPNPQSTRSSPRQRSMQFKPSCAALCGAWTPNPRPTAARLADFLANRSFIRVALGASPAPTLGSAAARQPFSHAVALQPPPQRRKPWRHSWVEVLRLADTQSSRPEGVGDYGCWLYPARGTGVWVHTGRSAVWSTWGHAWATVLQATGTRTHDDAPFARTAASKGYDSFQILRSHGRAWGWVELGETAPTHELVLATAPCMRRKARLPSGCVPVEVRTGPNASLPCGCDGTSYALLNCAGTPISRSAERASCIPPTNGSKCH